MILGDKGANDNYSTKDILDHVQRGFSRFIGGDLSAYNEKLNEKDWVSRKIKRLGITPTDKIGRVNYYTPKDADHIASYLFRLAVNDKAGAQRALAGESSDLINFDHDPDKTRITRLTDRVNSLTQRLTDSDNANDELKAENESLQAQNDQFQKRLLQAINDRNTMQLQLDQATKTIEKLTALDDRFDELKDIMLGRGQRHKAEINDIN